MSVSKLRTKKTFHLITSKVFWVGAPLVITEILRRGHYITVYDENTLPSIKNIIDCDVLVDMSAISDPKFYSRLEAELKKSPRHKNNCPFLVDPPWAIKDSLDKSRTHEIFRDLVPKSFNLNGNNNNDVFNKFDQDDYIVIKPRVGWWGEGVRKLSLKQARDEYKDKSGFVAQQLLPIRWGVGRIVTLNYKNDFEIVCAYSRFPNGWRTGVDVEYICKRVMITKKLFSFARQVSQKSGLYFNGIDYIRVNDDYWLLEVNSVPAIKEPLDELGVNVPQKLLDHIERNLTR